MEREVAEREKEREQEKENEEPWLRESNEGDEDEAGSGSESESGNVVSDEDVRGREEEEGVYEVAETLDKHVTPESGRLVPREVVRYLVRWKNRGDEANSWERLENLSGCLELVKEFEERLAARGDRMQLRTRAS